MRKFAFNLSVSAALIAILLARIDVGLVFDKLLAVELSWVVAASLIMTALTLPLGLRWTLVLRGIGQRFSVWTAVNLVFVGHFFSQTLPSAFGGDAMRMWLAYRKGLSARAAVTGVLIDRLIALAAVVLVMAASLPALESRSHDARLVWALGGIVGAGVAGFALLPLFDRIPAAFGRWRLVRALIALSQDLRRLARSVFELCCALALGVLNHIVVAFAVYLLAVGLRLPIGLVDCLVLIPPVMLATAVPLSIAGWGVREGGMVLAFGLIGVAPADALAVSVLYGLIGIIAGAPGGIVWILLGSRAPKGRDLKIDELGDPATAPGDKPESTRSSAA